MKECGKLKVADFKTHPVWEFLFHIERAEPVVKPVKKLLVRSLGARLVGLQVRLANGKEAWAQLSNVSVLDPRLTTEFLTVSIEKDGKWFHLARYHDVDYERHGPAALADFLGMAVSDVFPISYDLRPYVEADESALVGTIPKEPSERISDEERLRMVSEDEDDPDDSCHFMSDPVD